MSLPSSPLSTKQRSRWSATTKTLIMVLLILGGIALLQRTQLLFTPLILAVILAFVLNPVVNFFYRWARVPRLLVLIVIYVIVVALLAVVVITVTPFLIDQISNLMAEVPAMLESIERLLERDISLGPFQLDLTGLLDETGTRLLDAIQAIGSQSVNMLGQLVTGVAGAGVAVILVFIVSFYLIKDGHRVLEWMYGIPPPPYDQDLRQLTDEANLIWSSFFRGQITLTLVVAVIIGTVSAILGLPVPLLMGVLAGLLELLPSLGHGIWLVTAVLLALFSGSTWGWMPLSNFWFAVVVVALHVVFQQVDLNYLIPRIIGRRVHLHPGIVILGILIGASLGGVLGIFLAAPTIATLRVLGRYVYAGFLDLDPFPQPVALEQAAEEDE